MNLLKEFKPALLFLGKFLAIYFVGNILYGLFIESYGDKADPVTRVVTHQTSWMLSVAGYNSDYEDHLTQPKIIFKNNDQRVLTVFEGCNGINVMIIFAAFVFAFGGPGKFLFLFIPVGLLIIHIFNLLRIGLLFILAANNSSQFYFFHKYFFTAILYVVVFCLWIVWVKRFNENRAVKATA